MLAAREIVLLQPRNGRGLGIRVDDRGNRDVGPEGPPDPRRVRSPYEVVDGTRCPSPPPRGENALGVQLRRYLPERAPAQHHVEEALVERDGLGLDSPSSFAVPGSSPRRRAGGQLALGGE